MNTAKQASAASQGIKSIEIDLAERSYKIHVGHGLLENDIQSFLPFSLEGRNVFVLTDENVSIPHAGTIYTNLMGAGVGQAQMLALPAGEATKSFESYQRVIAWLLDHNVNRQSVLFAVGGGVIGDLGGFAAASVMRGIHYVQVPTTLLAQVDSAVGGKTGINVPQGKNLVGSFYQPRTVISDIATLETLPRRELLAGYAEVLKYGLLGDKEFFIWLEKSYENILNLVQEDVTKAIEISCRKKAEIVAADEHEKGQRALLNLGHTFGHALEAAAGYDGRLLHGEAVAMGINMAFDLSVRAGLCDQGDADAVEEHCKKVGLPVKAQMIFPPLDVTAEEIWTLMQGDKKVKDGQLNYILVHGIGDAFVTADVSKAGIIAVIENSLGEA